MTSPLTSTSPAGTTFTWNGPADAVAYDEEGIRQKLLNLHLPVHILSSQGKLGAANQGQLHSSNGSAAPAAMVASVPALTAEQLGDPAFKATYGLRLACYAGAMANAIASVEMVVAMGKAGMLGSFGAAGMVPPRLEDAILRIQSALPDGPYAFNLIHSPNEPAMEHRAVELYLKHGIRAVEASAFIDLTPSIVYYRLAGLSQDSSGQIRIGNRVIAKLSRREVAARFLSPAPADLVQQLLGQGLVTPEQARLSEVVPMADDITVEGDSGGHTDNRPLVGLVPAIIALRDELQEKYQYPVPVRVGAAGGISTPSAALAALMMGAAFVATGSVNQACLEAGASEHTRKLLARASMADVVMAPSADMFEMGVRVQVLKLGTMFPMRAARLYELYTRYECVDDIPAAEREKIEQQIFRRPLVDVWADTVKFFTERDPAQIERARSNPRYQMALIFRWYLGLSSRWSNSGEPGREMDYQIWCGPSIGPFNDWTRGTYMALPENRRVADVNAQILTGAAYQYRVQSLKMQGVQIDRKLEYYYPLAR